jgi:hypothetical protein
VLVHRLDTVLARTDPFDLAQALERYIGAMSADRIRSVVIDARDRIGEYYRAEFIALLEEYRAIAPVRRTHLNSEGFVQVVRHAKGEDALRRAFARLLKSNLRAVPLFGATFTEAVLEHVPHDRTVGFSEEHPKTRMRAAVFGGVAVALVLLGAAGEHVIANVRAQNSIASPLPQIPAPIVGLATATPHARAPAIASARTPSPATPRPATPPPTTPAPTTEPSTAPTSAPTPEQTKPPPAPRPRPTPPHAQGVATIALPEPTPTPEPSDLDTTDMPDVFTDATPIPSQSPAPVEMPAHVSLKTPTPPPKKKSWLKRALNHLNPFKP